MLVNFPPIVDGYQLMKGTEHYINRDQGRVYYYKVGKGDPLTFIHNVDYSGWYWKRVVDRFAEHFTCYIIDLPGFDHSDIPHGVPSVEDYTQAVVDVLDSANVGLTNIMGYHVGSMIGVILAATLPERVNRMVLSGLPYWNKERGRIVWERFFLNRFTDTTSFDVAVDPLTSWEEAVKKDPNLDQERWEKREEIKLKSRLRIRLSFEAMTNYDVEAAGQKVLAPTLLLNGEGDVIRRGEERAREGIRGSILKVIPGSNGPAHWDRPEEFTKLALRFLLNSQ